MLMGGKGKEKGEKRECRGSGCLLFSSCACVFVCFSLTFPLLLSSFFFSLFLTLL